MTDSIFNVKKFNLHTSSKKIVICKICTNSVVLVLTDGTVLRYDHLASENGDAEEIEIAKRHDDSIDNIFLDPNGVHCILSMKSCENFYLHYRSVKAKKISRLQGLLSSVAFDPIGCPDSSTKSFLVGTSLGLIYEICLDSTGKERVCQQVRQIDRDQMLIVSSLYFEYIAGSDGSTDAKIFVLCATSNPMRLYQFLGGPTFSLLFSENGQRGSASYTELPSGIERAELRNFDNTFGLMTELGIYHGQIQTRQMKLMGNSEDLVWSLMPYPQSRSQGLMTRGDDTVPLAIAVTEYHFLALSGDTLKAMCRLNGELVYEKDLRKGEIEGRPLDGHPIGLVHNVKSNSIFMFTDSSLYEITCTDEDRNIWRIHLHKAQQFGDEQFFSDALSCCKTKDDTNEVYCAHANFHMDKGAYDKAASCFARAGITFEDASLRILGIASPVQSAENGAYGGGGAEGMDDRGAKLADASAIGDLLANVVNGPKLFALRSYLTEALRALPLSAKSQRTMLCTWLCEVYLHQISCASISKGTASSASSGAVVGRGSAGAGAGAGASTKSGGPTEAELVAQFKEFLRTNKSAVDHSTTFSQLSSRGGRTHRNLLLFYIQIVGDYANVLAHHISGTRFADAIAMLREAPFEKVESLIYKNAPLLIEYEPESTVNMLIAQPKLKVSNLLPALLRYSALLDNQLEAEPGAMSDGCATRLDMDFEGRPANFAIRYLQACVENEDTVEPSIYHTLVTLLTKYDTADETELVVLLQRQCDRQADGLPLASGVDFNFVLRQCKRNGRRRATVLSYLLLGLNQRAVEEALHLPDDMVLAKSIASRPADEEEKKALWLTVAKHAIQSERSAKKALQILAESNDVLRIEHLLPHLPEFTEIDLFKDEICRTLEDCSARIDHLKSEMKELSDTAEGIAKELEGMKKRGYSASASQRCEYCPEGLFSRQFYLFPCSHGMHTDCLLRRTYSHHHLDGARLSAVKGLEEQLRSIKTRAKDDKRALAQQELWQNELDGYIAGDCPLCGYIMIQSLEQPLITQNDVDEARSWDL